MSESVQDRIDRELAEFGYPPVLCQAHVAKILGVIPRSVRRYQAEGQLVPLRPGMGRFVRYRRREVARFLSSKESE